MQLKYLNLINLRKEVKMSVRISAFVLIVFAISSLSFSQTVTIGSAVFGTSASPFDT